MGLLRRSDVDRLTYHGSGPRRGMLKHGGQAGRWQDEKDRLGRSRGNNRDKSGPRGKGK